MKFKAKTIWANIGISGVIVLLLWGNLIYMNIRPADPILPGWEEFDETRFKNLMNAGEPVMIEVYASWCPTCLRQHQALESLYNEGYQPKIRAIRVDFDRDELFREKYGIGATGMMLIFRNGEIKNYASGLTDEAKIKAFVENSLARL